MADDQRFLTVYDYGTGGVWAWVSAPSADAILAAYPELQIVDELPDWLEDEPVLSIDLDDDDHPVLAALRGSRGDDG